MLSVVGFLCVTFVIHTNGLQITSPSDVAADYKYQLAGFSPKMPETPILAEVVLAEPVNGCGPITNDVTGKIVLIRRGGCLFFPKIQTSEAANASVTIIGNNAGTVELITMVAGACVTTKSPSLFIGKLDFDKLEASLKAGNKLMGKIVTRPCGDQVVMELLSQSINNAGLQWVGPNACLWRGVNCDGDGRVRTLTDFDLCSTASAPRNSTRYNTGSDIPVGLCSMKNLQGISLTRTKFQGTLPDISNCSSLTDFILSSSAVSGTIPSTYFSHPALLRLDLSRNQLSSNLPPITSTQLIFVDLSNNNLSGDLPVSLQKLTAATAIFNFAGNAQLTGEFPAQVLQTASAIDISRTRITLPNTLLNTTMTIPLGALYASQTSRAFSLPSWIPSQVGNLQELKWSGNQLLKLPVLTSLTKLVALDISNNSLQMSAFDLLSILPTARTPIGTAATPGNFERLDASANQFFGAVNPERFARFANFDDNRLNQVAVVTSKNNLGSAPYIVEAFSAQRNSISTIDVNLLDNTATFHLDLTDNPISDVGPFVISSIPTSSMNVYLSTHMQCPSRQSFSDLSITLSMSPVTHKYNLCECIGGYYPRWSGPGNQTLECISCPEGVICPGRNEIVVQQGRWASPSSTNPQVTYECPNQGTVTLCNPSKSSVFECLEGHTGRKCSACKDGYGHAGGYMCVQCQYNGMALAGFVLFVVCIFTVATARKSPAHVETYDPETQFSYKTTVGEFSRFVQAVQYIALVLGAFRFPTVLAPLYSITLFSHATSMDTASGCYVSPYASFVASAVSPLVVIVYSVIVYGIRLGYSTANPKTHAIQVAIWLLNVLFLPVTKSALSFMLCEYDAGFDKYFYTRYPETECYSDMSLGGPLAVFIIFSIGLNILEFAMIYRWNKNDMLNQEDVAFAWGQLYLSFKPGQVYTHPLSLLVRTVVVVCLSIRGVATYVAALVLLVWVVYLDALQPFASRIANIRECAYIAATIVLMFIGALAEAQGGDDGAGFAVAVIGFVFVVGSSVAYSYIKERRRLKKDDVINIPVVPPS